MLFVFNLIHLSPYYEKTLIGGKDRVILVVYLLLLLWFISEICDIFDDLGKCDDIQSLPAHMKPVYILIVLIYSLLQCRQLIGSRGLSQNYIFSTSNLKHAINLLNSELLAVQGEMNMSAALSVINEVI